MTVALYLWAFIQNFIVGAALAVLKRSRTNSLLAAVFLVMSAATLAHYLFRFTDLKFSIPRTIFLTDVLDFTLPVMVLGYLAVSLGKPLSRKHAAYLLPVGGLLLFGTGYVWSYEEFGFFDYIGTTFHKMVLGALILWKAFIFAQATRMLRPEAERLKAKGIMVYWWPRIFQYFLLSAFVLGAIQLFYHTLISAHYDQVSRVPFREVIQFLLVSVNSLLVLAVAFYMFRFPRVISGKPLLRPVRAEAEVEIEQYLAGLIKAMDEDRVYLDGDLNEQFLAAHLGIPSYILSRLLNERIGRGFSSFVNEYRVREARRILENDPEKAKTNYAVALESGFRSESVFYVNFKKIAGTTPSKYRKQVLTECVVAA